MTSVRLAPGVEAPAVGLGTFQLEGRTCREVVERALALGYRHVDTAQGYGNEEEVGRAVRRSGVPRDEVFLVSKVWRDHLRPAELRSRLEGTLRRLRTDYLDLYLVHWPNSDIPARETARGMEELREEGLIRSWGVSNYTPAHLEELPEGAQVATNQVELHPFFRQDSLVEYCCGRSLPLTCYSPLARGGVLDDRRLREVAGDHGRSPAQIALRWSVQEGRLVIPKSSGEEHLRENLEVLDFELGDEEMEAVGSRRQGERLFDFEWAEFDR